MHKFLNKVSRVKNFFFGSRIFSLKITYAQKKYYFYTKIKLLLHKKEIILKKLILFIVNSNIDQETNLKIAYFFLIILFFFALLFLSSYCNAKEGFGGFLLLAFSTSGSWFSIIFFGVPLFLLAFLLVTICSSSSCCLISMLRFCAFLLSQYEAI